MTANWVSTTLHSKGIVAVYVGFAKSSCVRLTRRIMLMALILGGGQQKVFLLHRYLLFFSPRALQVTYSMPRLNITSRPSLWPRGSCKAHICESGNDKTMRSVTRLRTPVAIKAAFLLAHLPPSTAGFQLYSNGVHKRKVSRIELIAQAKTTAPTTYIALRNPTLTPKRRQYKPRQPQVVVRRLHLWSLRKQRHWLVEYTFPLEYSALLSIATAVPATTKTCPWSAYRATIQPGEHMLTNAATIT